jgi:hypothetical protein
METTRSFLAGAFLAAATLSVFVAVVSPALALPVAFVARAGTVVEFVGSMAAGVAAAIWSGRSKS